MSGDKATRREDGGRKSTAASQHKSGQHRKQLESARRQLMSVQCAYAGSTRSWKPDPFFFCVWCIVVSSPGKLTAGLMDRRTNGPHTAAKLVSSRQIGLKPSWRLTPQQGPNTVSWGLKPLTSLSDLFKTKTALRVD